MTVNRLLEVEYLENNARWSECPTEDYCKVVFHLFDWAEIFDRGWGDPGGKWLSTNTYISEVARDWVFMSTD